MPRRAPPARPRPPPPPPPAPTELAARAARAVPEMRVRSPRGVYDFIKGDFIGGWMLGGAHWEEHMLQTILPLLGADRPPGVVLDVGANVGTHTVPYARCRPTHAFEANPAVFHLLARNAAANGVGERVVLHAAAVGSHAGAARIALGLPGGGAAGYDGESFNYGGLSLGAGGARVPAVALDGLGLPRVRFIKADIEGAEPLAFYGARKLITRDLPVICYEKNQRTVTPEMLAELRAGAPGVDPAELEAAARFDVAAFCAGLGYAPPRELDPTNFLLMPPGE